MADSTKAERLALLQRLERAVRDFEKVYPKFVKKWTDVVDKIDCDGWCADDESLLPVLEYLQYYDYSVQRLRDNLQRLRGDLGKITLGSNSQLRKKCSCDIL